MCVAEGRYVKLPICCAAVTIDVYEVSPASGTVFTLTLRVIWVLSNVIFFICCTLCITGCTHVYIFVY